SEKVEQSVKVVKMEVSTAEVTTAATTLQISKDKLTLAQTLIEIKAAKPKVITTAITTITAAGTRPKEKGIVMQEPFETPLPKLIISSQKPSQAKDKGKGKMIEAFVHMDTKMVKGSKKTKEGSFKRERSNLEQEDAKRQRLEEENESTELKRCLEIVPDNDDDVTIEATRLSSKPKPLLITRSTKKGGKAILRSSEHMEILKII
nr:hypothetical protein [Tanacetum cinerariifolium]